MLSTIIKTILPSPALIMDESLGYSHAINRIKKLLEEEKWKSVEEALEKKNHAELSLFVSQLATTNDERTVLKWYNANPHSFYATIAYAHYFINYAWDARGDGLGSTVTEDMALLFFQRLDQAHSLLEHAKRLKPEHPEPYSLDIVIEKARPYYGRELIDDLNRIDKMHIQGQCAIVNGLAQRWGGQKGEGLNYALELSANEPDGSPLHALIADAHIEVWMDFIENQLAAKNYFLRKEVKQDLLTAFEKTFPNQELRKDLDSLFILNIFAFCFYLAKLDSKAKTILTFLRGKSSEYPWFYSDHSVLASLDVNYAYSAIHKNLGVNFSNFNTKRR